MYNIVLLGGIGVGKDYILNMCIKEYNLTKVVTDTTRPIRKGEIDKITYNFVSDNKFNENLLKNKYIEHKKYNTVEGVWYYGTSKDSIHKNNTIIILDKDGFLEYKKHIPNCISIYISCIDDTERFYRSLNRLEDINIKDVKEVYRRIRTDEDKFKDIEKIVDVVIPQTYNETTINLIFNILDNLGVERR